MSDIIAQVKNFKRYYRLANLRTHLQRPAEDLIALYAAGHYPTKLSAKCLRCPITLFGLAIGGVCTGAPNYDLGEIR